MTDPAEDPPPTLWKEPDSPRLPRVALMGEFSAGKSTLANLMIGTNPLPVQVVATQLPPVWISYGTEPSVIVDLAGGETPCDLETLQGIVPEDTAFIRFFCEEEILTKCDIIDMPGISDPNMASIVWERIMPFADTVLWCTPSTQAWRQSEAAVWDGIDARIRDKSMLVLTRADMLLTDKDKTKVLKRVKGEAGALFAEMVMMSLLLARDAENDNELWEKSGADEFVTKFLNIVDDISRDLNGAPIESVQEPEPATAPAGQVVPRRPVVRQKQLREPPQAEATPPDPMSFMPKFS